MREWIDRLPEEKLGLISVCASEVAIEQVDWIWPGRLAVGKHTCIAGEPGAGKSQLTMFIAAAVSTAMAWPCGEGKAKQGSVIILSAEDGAADTIVPRLCAAGADLGRIHIISAVKDAEGRRSFSLQRDLALLEEEVGASATLHSSSSTQLVPISVRRTATRMRKFEACSNP
jgi:putative DNA primase/helicase